MAYAYNHLPNDMHFVGLQQPTRIERVIGFLLAIWGILFYSRLLSTMTEQFRVRSEGLRIS